MESATSFISSISTETIVVLCGVVFLFTLFELVRSVIRSIKRKIVWMISALILSGGGGGIYAIKNFKEQATKQFTSITKENQNEGKTDRSNRQKNQ